jgi:hypothetical protein
MGMKILMLSERIAEQGMIIIDPLSDFRCQVSDGRGQGSGMFY